jgi:hypothetical protein
VSDAPEQDVERLYGLALDEFIGARDATAQRLRSEGKADQAAAVKALRKPSNPAWVVNALARSAPDVIGELLDAGTRLREVQLAGGGDLSAATEAERAALDRAMRNAEEVATHAGLASEQTLTRVRETLHLAALDATVGDEVRRGAVVREGQASGFPGLAFTAPATGSRPAARPKAAKPRPAPKADRAAERRRARHQQQLAEAREKVDSLEQELAALERRVRDIGLVVRDAQREQEKATRQADRVRERLETARSKAAEVEAAGS